MHSLGEARKTKPLQWGHIPPGRLPMIATAALPKRYSLDEYRLLEESAEVRHEFHDGEVVPMTGGTVDHAAIISSLMYLFNACLKGTGFRVYGGELRVWIPEHNRGVYPDLSVFKGRPVLNGGRRDEVLNPCLLVEVLSSSTEAFDRGTKFRFYRSLPSFQDYMLVSQTEPLIEHYHRDETERWSYMTYQGLEASLVLPMGNGDIPLAEVYQGIEFTEAL